MGVVKVVKRPKRAQTPTPVGKTRDSWMGPIPPPFNMDGFKLNYLLQSQSIRKFKENRRYSTLISTRSPRWTWRTPFIASGSSRSPYLLRASTTLHNCPCTYVSIRGLSLLWSIWYAKSFYSVSRSNRPPVDLRTSFPTSFLCLDCCSLQLSSISTQH